MPDIMRLPGQQAPLSHQKPIRVAVIGGGCAAIASAFELTRPEHDGRYDVTVYQEGWRLGGKGASGRGPSDRIEEHGLHLWMGWYENAFRLTRECYAELARDRVQYRIADWTDAFEPDPFMGVTEQDPDGGWSFWKAHLPPTEGLPGDPDSPAARISMTDYMLRSVGMLRALLESLSSREGFARSSADAGAPTTSIATAISRFLRYGELATLAALIEAVGTLEILLGGLSGYPDNLVLRFLDAISSNARSQLEALVEGDVELRRLWTIVDLTLATLRGMIRFRLLTDPRGFDAIDEFDCREWLMLNGASRVSVESGYLRALYDLGFSYEDADPGRPRIAAGQALRAMVRAFFTYRGAFFWKMQSGMGDVVFAPFYEVLRRRGVRFEFFHRLENVGLADLADLESGERSHVATLEFDVQAEIRGGGAYQPLVDVRGLPCWPSGPDYSQLVEGERLEREGWNFESFWDRRRAATRTLRVGEDFDLVLLGVGLGAVPHVCREIVARDPRWRAMVDHVKTVATQAFQIWLRADMKELGWTDQPINVSGFVEPFDTWADMGHLIRDESWSQPPRALAYFCSVLADVGPSLERDATELPAQQRERVRHNAIRFLNRAVKHLWPNSVHESGSFRWELLAAPDCPGDADSGADAGAHRFDSQYWTANVNPSDRYALSLPGSQEYRISPLDITYDNLTIAGDWTDCGFNAGCVEAAVMSGRLAAHALSGSPALEQIVGFDHP
jgi:uncharacterized protein with NAD-binding domain and iron-sulfur cluster